MLLPGAIEVTSKSSPLADPVKDTDTGVIVSPVVTAATGKFSLSAACIAVAAAVKLVTSARLIVAEY